MLPWDFIQKCPKTIDETKMGIYAFLVEEPYLEKVLLEQLPKKEIPFSLYTGNEFTRDFVEEHFVNLSFFSSADHQLILNAENIPSGVLDFILDSKIDCSDRFLVLFFTKSSKSWNEFAKDKSIFAFELEMPRFWEGPKLWQFCQKVRSVQYDGVTTRYILENREHNIESFFDCINILKSFFPEGNVDVKKLPEIFKRERFDFFGLIDLFHQEPKLFFEEILKKEMDYDWIRGLCAFMQTHLLKVLYPQELRVKSKLSKYDQSVIEMSERLDRGMLKHYMRVFSDLEILSKSSDIFLINYLRLESLKNAPVK